MSALQPSNSLWLSEQTGVSPWLFRGQWDADWQLVPRLFRVPIDPAIRAVAETLAPCVNAAVQKQDELGDPDRARLRQVLTVASAEMELVERFRELADSVGHNVGDQWTYDGREWLKDDRGNVMDEQFCRPGLVGALAQNHGIPTRALDWTTHPLHAAFFASADTGHKHPTPARLAVWAMSTRCVGTRTQSNDPGYRLKRVWSPANRVAYLHAQHGVLVYDCRAHSHFMGNGRWPDVRESIEGSAHVSKDQTLLRKFTLPHTERSSLRRALAAHRVSYAFLMPTLDNVARTVCESYTDSHGR